MPGQIPESDKTSKFRDRIDAGQQLARLFSKRWLRDPIVLALPKGGVAVGLEIARELDAPLELLLVRKLCSPKDPGGKFGALSESGSAVMNEAAICAHDLGMGEIHECLHEAEHTLERRLMLYRPDHRLPGLSGRSVIVADDFADSGLSAQAALNRIRHERPYELFLALPVLPRATRMHLLKLVDELLYLRLPEYWEGPAAWYEDPRGSTEEEVIEMAARYGEKRSPVERSKL